MSGPAISKHLRVLERAGLIRQGRQAQWRPCHLEAAPLKAVADWTDSYRHFWQESFNRLEEYLEELQKRASASGENRSPAASPRRRATRTVSEAKRSAAQRSARRAARRARKGRANVVAVEESKLASCG